MIDNSSDDLTPEERIAFATLPRAHSATDQLAEERIVQALQRRHLLTDPGRRTVGRTPAIGIGIAAAMMLFAGGTVFGRELARREMPTASPAIAVQQAGTAYVAALVRLSKTDSGESPHNLVAGLEAGTATLRAAAISLAQIAPADTVVRRIRASLDAAGSSHGTEVSTPDGRPVVWF